MRWMARSTFLNFHESPNRMNSFRLPPATGCAVTHRGTRRGHSAREGVARHFPARILQVSRGPARYRAGAGRNVSSLLARLLRSGGSVRCRVLDAVRRRIEGAKASAFLNSGSRLDTRAAPDRSQAGYMPDRSSLFFASREDGHDRVCSTHRNWAACLRPWVRNCRCASWQHLGGSSALKS